MQSLAEVMKISAVQILESNSYFNIRFETSTIILNFRILTITNFLLKKA